MDLSARLVQTSGLDITEVDDGLVVYHPEHQRVHHLNVTAVLLFEMATGDNTVATMIDVVQRAFGLSAAPEAEVQAALGQLLDEGLIS